MAVLKRQYLDDGDLPWWYSNEGYAVRYGIIGAIVLVVMVYLFGGYLHANHRIQKGLPPLFYHRWMVRRSQRYPQHGHVEQYQMQSWPQQGPPANAWAPPPPAYNHGDTPPAYIVPGESKTAQQQEFAVTSDGQAPSSSNWQPAPQQMPQQPSAAYGPPVYR